MKGYYKIPEMTEEAIENGGWLHSGDLATLDKDGYYTIVGRIKDMIIRGGENIYSREIEGCNPCLVSGTYKWWVFLTRSTEKSWDLHHP